MCTETPKIEVTKSKEGLESKIVDIYGGDIDIVASDDGINATTGERQKNEKIT